MSATAHVVLLTVFVLATSIWVGGYVAIAVVARVATRTLDPARRVAFFRALGRSYLRLGVPALAIALVTGAVLLHAHRWDATVTAAVVVAAALVASLVVGVVQARRMTMLRASALERPEDAHRREKVSGGARRAGMLRGVIGLLSLALVVLGSVIAG